MRTANPSRLVEVTQWLVGVAAATAVVLLFTLDGAPDPDPAPVGETEQLLDQGRAVYAQTCSSCHGAEGQGGVGPRLAGTAVTLYPDAADEIAVVANGRRAMPAFAGTLTDLEIEAVVLFTRAGFD